MEPIPFQYLLLGVVAELSSGLDGYAHGTSEASHQFGTCSNPLFQVFTLSDLTDRHFSLVKGQVINHLNPLN